MTLHVDGEPVELRAEVDRLKGSIQTDATLRVGTRRYAGDLTGEVLDLRIDGAALDREEVLALASERALAPDGAAFFAACFDEESAALRAALTAATEERTASATARSRRRWSSPSAPSRASHACSTAAATTATGEPRTRDPRGLRARGRGGRVGSSSGAGWSIRRARSPRASR